MPLLDQITLTPKDLMNIIDLLEEKHYNGEVTVIDTNGTLTVRDCTGFCLGNVAREEIKAES